MQQRRGWISVRIMEWNQSLGPCLLHAKVHSHSSIIYSWSTQFGFDENLLRRKDAPNKKVIPHQQQYDGVCSQENGIHAQWNQTRQRKHDLEKISGICTLGNYERACVLHWDVHHKAKKKQDGGRISYDEHQDAR